MLRWPDEQLRAVWELAKWPPTSANTNPLRVAYVRTSEARRRLLPHLAEGDRAKSESAPVVAVLARDVDREFFPDGRWRSFLVVNIGRPGGKNPWFERLPRLDYHQAARLI